MSNLECAELELEMAIKRYFNNGIERWQLFQAFDNLEYEKSLSHS